MPGVNVQITITNLDEIKRAFKKSPELMGRALPDAINKSLLTIGKAAALNLREGVYDQPISASGYKRTGNLLKSILDPNGGLQLATIGVFSGSVGSATNYGIFVEEGTRFMPARPFLQPAVTATKDIVQEFFTEATQSVLNDIGKAT